MKPYLNDGDVRLYQGDTAEVMRQLPAESVDCCVTSPPYFGLRDYGVDGQIGLEATPDEFVAALVGVFREVRRLLAPHGVLWLNLGDSYAAGGSGPPGARSTLAGNGHRGGGPKMHATASVTRSAVGTKPKDLLGIPWRVALALQADGWWLRSDVVWSKPNPMPESVTDRPTRSHEYVFLLTKAPRYYFDAEAVREPHGSEWIGREPNLQAVKGGGNGDRGDKGARAVTGNPAGRNIRSVWTIATQPYSGAHFATFPQALVERCLNAACPERVCRTCGEPSRRVVEREAMVVKPGPGRIAKQDANGELARTAVGGTMVTPPSSKTTGWTDCGHDDWRPGVVLDPFSGSGTTAYVARRMGRHAVGIDLNPEYLALSAERLAQMSLFAEAA